MSNTVRFIALATQANRIEDDDYYTASDDRKLSRDEIEQLKNESWYPRVTIYSCDAIDSDDARIQVQSWLNGIADRRGLSENAPQREVVVAAYPASGFAGMRYHGALLPDVIGNNLTTINRHLVVVPDEYVIVQDVPRTSVSTVPFDLDPTHCVVFTHNLIDEDGVIVLRGEVYTEHQLKRSGLKKRLDNEYPDEAWHEYAVWGTWTVGV